MPRAVRETFPFGLCGSDELVWYGEGESMTSMSPVGSEAAAPAEGARQEEPLSGGEAVRALLLQCSALLTHRAGHGLVGQPKPAVVGGVFALGQ
jgi:hypothetical protein